MPTISIEEAVNALAERHVAMAAAQSVFAALIAGYLETAGIVRRADLATGLRQLAEQQSSEVAAHLMGLATGLEQSLPSAERKSMLRVVDGGKDDDDPTPPAS